jgi:hypothetical protein
MWGLCYSERRRRRKRLITCTLGNGLGIKTGKQM